MKILLSSIILVTLLFASSCKDSNPYTIPYTMVYFKVYPNGIDSDLGGGRVKYFPKYGFRGIVVYRMGTDQFLAYDRACTYDTEIPTAIVAVDPTGLIAVCPVCGSKYLLTDGYPMSGKARNPLLQYSASYDGQAILTITNK